MCLILEASVHPESQPGVRWTLGNEPGVTVLSKGVCVRGVWRRRHGGLRCVGCACLDEGVGENGEVLWGVSVFVGV